MQQNVQQTLQVAGERHVDHMTKIYKDFAITVLQMLVDDLREGPAGKYYKDALESLDDTPLFTLLEVADIRPDCFFDRIDEVLERQAHGENTVVERRYRVVASKRIRKYGV